MGSRSFILWQLLSNILLSFVFRYFHITSSNRLKHINFNLKNMNAFLLLLSVLLGILCHNIAQSKNRNKELWAILGFLFGIFAVIVISLLPNVPV